MLFLPSYTLDAAKVCCCPHRSEKEVQVVYGGDHVDFSLTPWWNSTTWTDISSDLLVWLDLVPQFLLTPLVDSNGMIDCFEQG